MTKQIGRQVIMEQRINIKFHAKLGTTATETYKLLKQVYGDDCLSRARVFDWHKQFREGRESVEDDERGAPPRTARNPEVIQKVRDFISENQNVSCQIIAEDLGISKYSVHKILTKDLGRNLSESSPLKRPHSPPSKSTSPRLLSEQHESSSCSKHKPK